MLLSSLPPFSGPPLKKIFQIQDTLNRAPPPQPAVFSAGAVSGPPARATAAGGQRQTAVRRAFSGRQESFRMKQCLLFWGGGGRQKFHVLAPFPELRLSFLFLSKYFKIKDLKKTQSEQDEQTKLANNTDTEI